MAICLETNAKGIVAASGTLQKLNVAFATMPLLSPYPLVFLNQRTCHDKLDPRWLAFIIDMLAALTTTSAAIAVFYTVR